MNTIPGDLNILQVGKPGHFEIVLKVGANLTPADFTDRLSRIRCGSEFAHLVLTDT